MPRDARELISEIAEQMREHQLQVATMRWPDFYHRAEVVRFRGERKEEIINAGIAAGIGIAFCTNVVIFAADVYFAPFPKPSRRRRQRQAPADRRAFTEQGEFKKTYGGTIKHMLFTLGYDRDTIWSKCQPHFQLPEQKRSYISWYQNEPQRLARKGRAAGR